MAFITAETRSSIVELAMGMLNQAPSTAMLETLIAKSVEGASTQDLADYIATTAAFTAEYPATQTAREFATEMFGKLITGGTLDAEINTAVIDLLEGLLTSGTTKAQGFVAVIDFLANPANAAHADLGDIAQSFQNRADAAEYFSITKELGGSTDAELTAAIASVTSDAATLTAANAAADATASAEAVVAGQTFTLTTAAETVVGTSGDDKFVGVTIGAGATGTTLLPGDVLEGGEGDDLLLLSTSGDLGATDYTVSAIQASGIETIHLNAFETDADENVIVDLTLMGAEVSEVGLASSNATGDVTFVNPKGMLDAVMANGSGDLTITYGALALGSADSQNLALINASAGTATFAGIETVNVTTSLANSKLTDLVIDGATALNISGDKKLTIASDVNFKDNASSTAIDGTIDASGSTGGVDLTFSSADNLAITGSAGDDVIRMGTTKNFYDTVDGGEGDDTVAISLSAASGAGIAYSYALAGLSNVENLDVTSTNDAASVDMEGVSADVTNVTLGSNVRTVTVGGTIDTAGEDLAFTLNGVTYAIETAGTTDDVDEIGAELATAINALTGFTAVASAGAATTDLVTITSLSGNAIEFSDLVNTTDATDLIATTVGDYTDASVTNLPDDGSVSVTVHSADDITLGLADGSGADDVVNLNLGTVAADKGFEKTIDSVTIAAVETLNIDTSGMTDKIDTNITTLTADSKLTTINFTGDSDVDLTGTVTASKLATIDASAATGDVAIDVPALTGGSTVKGGSGADNFVFEGALGLNAYDVVTGGEGSDKLSASIAGMTGVYAPLGALNVTDVERLNLTTAGGADASIDAAGIIGATEVAITGAGGITTLTNLAADVNLGLGTYAADAAVSGRVDVALADATGTEDALTVKLNDRATGNNNAIDLRASGIETVTFTVTGYGSTDTALADHTLTVNRLNAPTINVTGSTYDAGNTLSLGTLDTDTTTVDASTYNGLLTATAGTGVGVSISAKGDRVHTLTGSTGDDTFTLVGTVTNADSTIVGGGGDDTLNLTVGDGAADFDGVTAVDTINMSVLGGSGVTTDATDALDGINESSKLVVTGGNSLSTVTLGGANDQIDGGSKTNVLDFSGYAGKATVVYAANGFDDLELGYTQQVIGGDSLADTIIASYDADIDATVAINTQGVEAFQFTLGDSAVELVMDMTKVTGMGQINVLDTSDESVEIANLMAGTKVYAETTDTTNTVVEVKLASTTGSEDALTLGAAAASANDNLKFVVADVETVTIASLGKLLSVTTTDSNEVDLDLSEISMTAVGATTDVVLTGGVALEITATNADIASIDASARTAGVVQTGRSAETGSTYTGGSGADTFIMMSGSDVLTGGLGTDTLDVNLGAVLGGISVDLSSETNQVASMDGGAISGTVLGFENVDLSGYTGFGAVVQAIKTGSTITGTGSTDRITGGASADTIVWTAGNDVVSTGGGNDVLQATVALLANQSATTATFNLGSGTGDALTMTDAGTIADEDFARISNVEVLNLGDGTQTVTLTTNANAAGIVTINGGTGADTIVTGDGTQTITPGAGTDIITGGLGADTIDLTEAVAAADDVIITSGLTADTITAFAEATDDVLLDMSALEAANAAIASTTVDLVEIHDALSITDAAGTPAAVGVQVLTAAAVAADAKNFFVIDLGATKFANASAAVDALEAGGAAALTFAGNIAKDDGFFFAYENTTGDTVIALANFVAADDNSGGAAATGVGNLEGVDLVTLTGVADASVIDATNLFLF